MGSWGSGSSSASFAGGEAASGGSGGGVRTPGGPAAPQRKENGAGVGAASGQMAAQSSASPKASDAGLPTAGGGLGGGSRVAQAAGTSGAPRAAPNVSEKGPVRLDALLQTRDTGSTTASPKAQGAGVAAGGSAVASGAGQPVPLPACSGAGSSSAAGSAVGAASGAVPAAGGDATLASQAAGSAAGVPRAAPGASVAVVSNVQELRYDDAWPYVNEPIIGGFALRDRVSGSLLLRVYATPPAAGDASQRAFQLFEERIGRWHVLAEPGVNGRAVRAVVCMLQAATTTPVYQPVEVSLAVEGKGFRLRRGGGFLDNDMVLDAVVADGSTVYTMPCGNGGGDAAVTVPLLAVQQVKDRARLHRDIALEVGDGGVVDSSEVSVLPTDQTAKYELRHVPMLGFELVFNRPGDFALAGAVATVMLRFKPGINPVNTLTLAVSGSGNRPPQKTHGIKIDARPDDIVLVYAHYHIGKSKKEQLADIIKLRVLAPQSPSPAPPPVLAPPPAPAPPPALGAGAGDEQALNRSLQLEPKRPHVEGAPAKEAPDSGGSASGSGGDSGGRYGKTFDKTDLRKSAGSQPEQREVVVSPSCSCVSVVRLR